MPTKPQPPRTPAVPSGAHAERHWLPAPTAVIATRIPRAKSFKKKPGDLVEDLLGCGDSGEWLRRLDVSPDVASDG